MRPSARRRLRRLTLALLGATVVTLGLPVGATAGQQQEDGKTIFGQLCQGCHTLGGGDLAGPDLAGLPDRRERDWVRRFIIAPDEVIASGDPIAKELLDQYGAPMPNLGVTESQADALLAFLGFAAAPAPPPAPEPAPTPEPAPAPEPAPGPAPSGNATRGEDLFTGAGRFQAGGPSCLSCHSVAGLGALGGGQLGPDLTGAYDKYGGEQGLRAVLETMPFPTMTPIFARKPLTVDEQADLVAFLARASDKSRSGSAAGQLVALSGAAVFALIAAGLVIWRRRLFGVRASLVNRSKGK